MHRVSGPIAYIMKRYPRLTETFILNEIRAMERLGADLHIFSLLSPEPPPHHPMVAEVAAPIYSVHLDGLAEILELARAHADSFAASPLRYLKALGRALIWSMHSSRPLSTWRQFIRAGFVATTCRRNGIRHMHAHFANAPTAVAQFASLMSGIPFSFTAHAKDLYLTSEHAIRRRAAAAEFVVTCTSYNVQYLESIAGVHAAKFHLVYHGVDLSVFRTRPVVGAASIKPPLILSVGRLVAKKGHDDLITACAILRAKDVEFKCQIVGEGPLRAELQAQIEAAGLSGNVTLEGAMTHAKLIALYAEAEIFALSPRIADDGDRDGIPNVIAEAMAIGVPVITTAVSGIPELVRHQRTGLLVPPNNPPALAEAMLSGLLNRSMAASLAQAARTLLEQEFDLWSTTRRLHKLIGCDECAIELDNKSTPPRSAPGADQPRSLAVEA